MDRYPFYLVTRGQHPRNASPPNTFYPVALAKKTVGFRSLVEIVERRVHLVSLAAIPKPTSIDVLQAGVKDWTLNTLSNLWCSEVRLASDLSDVEDGEEAIDWVLAGDTQGRLPQRWQGPAAGVIPDELHVTIRLPNTAFPFEVQTTVSC